MKVLAVVKKVGSEQNAREYVSQRGNHGWAYPVAIGTELGELVFEAFVDTKERLQERGLVVGAVGTIEVSARSRNYTDRNGAIRYSNDLNVDGYSWQLANQNLPKKDDVPAAQVAPAPMEKTPEMEAAAQQMMAAAQADAANGEGTGLPF